MITIARENGFLYKTKRLSLVDKTAFSGRENGFLSRAFPIRAFYVCLKLYCNIAYCIHCIEG